MYDLQLLGVHDDGEHVVFLGTDGQRYRVLIDDALRAAVRRDRAHLGQIQVSSQTLRPRDIQAKVRAGQRAEEIAAESGLPLDYIQRFEGPVLAERENVVTRARQTRIRRRDEIGPMLGQLADERLEARGVDLQYGTIWDAWRQDDGTWTVQLMFSAGGKDRTARWRFDMPAAHLTPTDDESRWLTSEQQDQPGGRRHREGDADGALDRILRRRMETVEISTPWREQRDGAQNRATPSQPTPPQPSPPIALPEPSDTPTQSAAAPQVAPSVESAPSAPEDASAVDQASALERASDSGLSSDVAHPEEPGQPADLAHPSDDEYPNQAAQSSNIAQPGLEAAGDPADSDAQVRPGTSGDSETDTTGRAPTAAPADDSLSPETVSREAGRDESELQPEQAAEPENPATDTAQDTQQPQDDAPLADVPRPDAGASSRQAGAVDLDDLPPAAHPADSHPEDLEDGTIVASAGEGDSYIEVSIDTTDTAPPKSAAGQSNPETVDEDEAKEQVETAAGQSRQGRDNRPKPGPRPRKQQKRRNNRASVPSWDDILFGAKKD